MADNATPGLGDLLTLLGNNNPITGVTRTVAQFQRGVNDLLTTLEHLNGALEQFNQMATRVNALLDLVEEPLKAFVPQVTRTLRAADDLVDRLSGPVDAVAPGLVRLADTLSNPALTALPRDLNEFLDVLRDLARRMQPLGQMAETAGGLFSRGPFASLLGMAAPARPEPASPPPPSAHVVHVDVEEEDEPEPVAARSRQVRPRTAATTRTPAKKAAAKRPAKKAGAKKAAPPR